VANDVENWSSFSVTVVPSPTQYDDEGNRLRSVITTDPPDHTPERRLMLPFFSPKSVERYREHTQELCRRLIRDFIEDGRADIAEDYARQIPPRIIAAILGIDPEMAEESTTWVQGVLELGLQDDEVREHYAEIIRNFFLGEIKDRMENPGDDLISFLLGAESTASPSACTSSAATSGSCRPPGSTPRGVRSDRRSGTSPPTRRTAGGSSTTPS